MKFLLPYVAGCCNPVNTIMDLDIDSTFDMGRALQSGNIWTWEREVFACLLACISSTSNPEFMDIGANIGFYSIASKMLFGDSITCMAVEANPRALEKIKRIAQANGASINLCERALVGDASEHVDFYIYPADSNSSCIRRGGFKEKIQVQATTLAAIYKGSQIIKIDTEGTEYDILYPAIKHICQAKPYIIIEILTGEMFHKIYELFSKNGYTMWQLLKNFEINPVDSYPGFGNREYNFLLSPNPDLSQDFIDKHGKWKNAINLTSNFVNETYVDKICQNKLMVSRSETCLEYLEYCLSQDQNLILFPMVSSSWLAFHPSDFPRLIHYEFMFKSDKLYICFHFEMKNNSLNLLLRDRLLEIVFPQRKFLSYNITPVIIGNGVGLEFGLDFRNDFFNLDKYLELMDLFVDKTAPVVRNMLRENKLYSTGGGCQFLNDGLPSGAHETYRSCSPAITHLPLSNVVYI